MGRALADAFAESREVFARGRRGARLPALEALLRGARGRAAAHGEHAAGDPGDEHRRAAAARGPRRPARAAWPGHSLGEYCALVAAGALSLADALRTVRRRGQYMQEAVPVGVGAMAAILGLELAAIEAACREAAQGEVVSPANVNSPGTGRDRRPRARPSSGPRPCARRTGAKRAVPLPVSAPFHCALMQPAQDRLAPELAALAFARPRAAARQQRRRRGGAGRGRLPGRAGAAGVGHGALAGVGRAAGPRRASRPSSRWARARVLSGLVKKIAKGSAGAERRHARLARSHGRRPAGRRGGMMALLEGRVSLVTGASRGIGLAIARGVRGRGRARRARRARRRASSRRRSREIQADGRQGRGARARRGRAARRSRRASRRSSRPTAASTTWSTTPA